MIGPGTQEGGAGSIDNAEEPTVPGKGLQSRRQSSPDGGKESLEFAAAPTVGRVLIVDDNAAVHRDFSDVLNPDHDPHIADLSSAVLGGDAPATPKPVELRFEIASAYQGQEALKLVEQSVRKKTPFSVAFLDMRMPPGWDGMETLTRVWGVDPRIQVVLCTAHSDYTWDEIFHRFGTTDQLLILRKPFEMIEVRQLAHMLVTKWQLARERERRMAELERRVAERSRELEAANRQMRREMEERARFERARRRAQRLQEIGRLAAGIGHEINNPLGFFIGSIEEAQRELESAADNIDEDVFDEINDCMQAAFVGGDRITQLVRNIKMFARPREDAIELVDTIAIVERALGSMRIDLGTNVRVETSVEQLPPVLGKPRELEQVFVNLLKNAAYAVLERRDSEAGIRITGRCDQQGDLSVQIADSGGGIDSDDLSRIFDPFFTTKPVNKGTGLGLSICHAIVSAHGGSIDVNSTRGQGTVVTVYLPAARA